MPHCRNSYKIKSKSRIKRDKMDTTHFPGLIIKKWRTVKPAVKGTSILQITVYKGQSHFPIDQ
jgi:hypothetical protein